MAIMKKKGRVHHVSGRTPATPSHHGRVTGVAVVTILSILALGPYDSAHASQLIYPVHGEPVAVAQYNFDFTAFPEGFGTPFSETLTGSPHGPMTIKYSSTSGDPGAFAVGPSPLRASTLLRDASAPTATLVITLARPVYGIAVLFQTFDAGPFHMDFFSHGTLVATLADDASGGFLGLVPIGAPSFYANHLDAIAVYIEPGPLDAGSFGIDQVFAFENVPEPTTVSIVAVGFVGLALLCCRRAAPSTRSTRRARRAG
jgi:hypothetical protein